MNKLPKYCNTCDEENASEKCKCGNIVCLRCTKQGDIIFINDWLDVGISNQCEICKKIGCKICIETCLECWSVEGFASSICIKCAEKHNSFSVVECEFHCWRYCKKCAKNGEIECAECLVNKNYDLRHQYTM